MDDCFHPPITDKELVGIDHHGTINQIQRPILHWGEQSQAHHQGNVLCPTLKEEHPPWLYIQIYQYL